MNMTIFSSSNSGLWSQKMFSLNGKVRNSEATVPCDNRLLAPDSEVVTRCCCCWGWGTTVHCRGRSCGARRSVVMIVAKKCSNPRPMPSPSQQCAAITCRPLPWPQLSDGPPSLLSQSWHNNPTSWPQTHCDMLPCAMRRGEHRCHSRTILWIFN